MSVKRIDQLDPYVGDLSADDLFAIWNDADSATQAATLAQIIAAVSAGLPPSAASAFALFQPNVNLSFGSMSQGTAVVQRFIVPQTTVVDHSRFFWFGGSSGVVANIALYDAAGALLDTSNHTGSSADTLEMAFGADVQLDPGVPYFCLFVLTTAGSPQTVQCQSQPSSHDGFAYNVSSVTSIPGTLPGSTNTGGDMPLVELFHS